jgi:cysteinyl-tRNA synthetase
LQDCEDALSPFQQASLKDDGPEQKSKTAQITPAAQECISKLRSEFHTKMSDDLNTAQILTGAFQEALKFINSSLNMLKVYFWNSIQEVYDVLSPLLRLSLSLYVVCV